MWRSAPAVTPRLAWRASGRRPAPSPSSQAPRLRHARWRGLTLLELVIALAVLGILATLTLPALGGALQRHRLLAAAQTLASDLSEARFEAARSGQSLHLLPRSGPDWCWAVTATPACDCASAQPCQLARRQAAEHGGIQLLQAAAVTFSAEGIAPAQTAALLANASGQQLRVDISPLGRTRICAPEGSVAGAPAC